jgi:hypothetical protein
MSFKEVVAAQRMRALTYPCERPEQCENPGFLFTVNPAQGVQCGVNLTINVGEE